MCTYSIDPEVLGCQMIMYFQTKIKILGKSGRVLQWEILEYVMAIWSILNQLGIFYGHLVYCKSIWYILWPHGKYDLF
jgi:hypothetical protein